MKINIYYILIFSLILVLTCSWNNPWRPGVTTTSDSSPIKDLKLISAVSTGYAAIELTFNKNLNQSYAENINNYSIASLTIDCAELLFDKTKVRLLTTIQENTQYTVIVSNVRDEVDNQVIIISANSASFNGVGYVPGENFVPTVTVTTTIQAEIDAASPGDVIYVPPGTYTENITINKQIILLGAGSGSDPISNTIFDGTGDAQTV